MSTGLNECEQFFLSDTIVLFGSTERLTIVFYALLLTVLYLRHDSPPQALKLASVSKTKGSSILGRAKIGADISFSFRVRKARSAFGVHSNFAHFSVRRVRG